MLQTINNIIERTFKTVRYKLTLLSMIQKAVKFHQVIAEVFVTLKKGNLNKIWEIFFSTNILMFCESLFTYLLITSLLDRFH